MQGVLVVFNIPLDNEYTYSLPPEMEGERLFGKRVVVPFGRSEKTGFVIEDLSSLDDTPYEIKEIKRVVDEEVLFTPELVSLARWMKSMYFSSVGTNISLMVPSGRRESEYSPFDNISSFSPVSELTDEQNRALKRLREDKEGVFYLFGVTGSGKTEVYLRRAEEVIKEGKEVIYLVPEITLTHQLKGEVYHRFNGRVAILHSLLTPSQKLKEWKRIISGEVDIVIGARSSVFAPCLKLGLIILDEEHEASYKSGSNPRYSARQIAQHRASITHSQFIMGSATPSMEAWKLMKSQKINSIVMKNRIGKARYPKVSIVDMNGEEKEISETLEKEIRRALSKKRGVILFLNRRGFSYGYVCKNCGHVIECPNCSVSLTYHKKEKKLICHTCGYSTNLIKTCPVCGSHELAASGFGTERAEEEVKLLFPQSRVVRLDTDVSKSSKEKTAEILKDFREGNIDILLGTQMIAKGLNFPLVSLVGVLNADSSLSLPDFRAGERTFSLLYQVSGRAGRYSDDGRVIIQTRQSLNRAIVCVEENRVDDFYTSELTQRRETLFPPYTRLINLTVRSKSEDKARLASQIIEETALRLNSDEDIEIFSSSPCLVEKQAQQWRYHVLLRSTRIAPLLHLTRRILSEIKLPNNAHLEVDVDPVSML